MQIRPYGDTIPVQLTALVGREQALKTVCALLQCPEVRLATLTGMGGVGKTRLGLQVATGLLSTFADGVCFVSLASLRDSSLVVPAIARALGLAEDAEQPLRPRLKAYLCNKQLLLLLDSFEHVARAAPLLVELLQTCPDLKALVTSRSPLHVRGEYEFHVPPLTLPDVEQLAQGEAFAHCASVALFVQCAQSIKSDFALTGANAHTIAEICIRLEGLPLAIELAAARIRLFSPQELLAWLEQRLPLLTNGARDVPERQQTLLKTLTWSYDLLSAREQRLFRQLAVFADGCTLEAVEALYGAGAENALDEVGALVEKNLLQRTETAGGETRLVMPEMIREFGLECLKQSGELEAAQRTLALYHPALAEEIEQKPTEAALTAREGEVLRLLTAGLTSAQIAERLVLSRHTVNIHVRSIYSKLGVNSRSAATRYAFEHHLI